MRDVTDNDITAEAVCNVQSSAVEFVGNSRAI